MTTYQLDAMRVPCPVCGAPKGSLCDTIFPPHTQAVHEARAVAGAYATPRG